MKLFQKLAAFIILGMASSIAISQQDRSAYSGNISVVTTQEMAYPVVARVANIQGLAVVRVKLDNTGNVIEAAPISGHKVLMDAAIANARKWRFSPNPEKEAVIVYDFQLVPGRCDRRTNGSLFVFREPNVASVVSCSDVLQPARGN